MIDGDHENEITPRNNKCTEYEQPGDFVEISSTTSNLHEQWNVLRHQEQSLEYIYDGTAKPHKIQIYG